METKKATISKINVVIDCKDAGIMARFYSQLLNWEWTHPQANGWSAITSPAGMVIAFQEIEEYEPPVWPWQAGNRGKCYTSISMWTTSKKPSATPSAWEHALPVSNISKLPAH